MALRMPRRSFRSSGISRMVDFFRQWKLYLDAPVQVAIGSAAALAGSAIFARRGICHRTGRAVCHICRYGVLAENSPFRAVRKRDRNDHSGRELSGR